MTGLDPRTPVVVGAGQLNDRDHGSEPIDLMSRCVEAALEDTGAAGRVRSRIGSVRVVWGVWPYRDPGRLVAERIGAPGARTTLTANGGNQTYDLVIDTAARIRTGDLDVAVVCGADPLRTRRADHARGVRTAYLDEPDDAAPDEAFGGDHPMFSEAEAAIGLDVVARFYAMAETALRHRLGEDVDAHRMRIAGLWARASEIAAANPHAWSRTRLDAETIATESPSNRPVASPYPKLMTSNLNVDQGGAVLICSAGAAEDAGVPRDRWIFPWSGVGAADPPFATNRWELDASPGMRHAGTSALALAGVGHEDCALLDLYSCFPVAVQVAQRELGIPPDRDFTFTGGLTFAAGPLNCYCLLPLTRAVELLRAAPGERAFLTGNGGVFSKHSALVLSGDPPPGGFRTTDEPFDPGRSRPTPTSTPTEATLESSTVISGRDGEPERALLACLDADGHRHWAESHDRTTMQELLARDCCGRLVALDGRTGRLAG